jgi:ligand-binding SRPBCC domain-containing protein
LFFSEARNLEKLTPPWLRFEVLTEGPITMAAGTLIDYRISWRGIPMRWRTEIEVWEPNHRFVDRQIPGGVPPLAPRTPLHREQRRYASVIDRVEYAPIGGALANRLVVARDVERIFASRHEALRKVFGSLSTI